MAPPSELTVERFLALLLVTFPDTLRSVLNRRKLGRRQGTNTTETPPVPSDLALSAFVLAGQTGRSAKEFLEAWRTPTAARTVEQRTDRRLLRATCEHVVTPAMTGTDPFDSEWLRALWRGLGGAPGGVDAVLVFAGFRAPESQAVDKQILLREYREARSQLSGKLFAANNPTIREALVRTAERLAAMPPGYPGHLDPVALGSSAVAAVVLDLDRATRTTDSGLYSGFVPLMDREPALELLARERRTILLGDPGSGKSTVLAAHCIETVRAGRIALYARLDDLAELALAEHVPRTPVDALGLVIDAWDNWRGAELASELRSLLARQAFDLEGVVVALDGLDEVGDPRRRDACIQVIEQLSCNENRATLLIASRITGYTRPLNEASQVVLAPLPEGGPGRFIDQWFGDRPENADGRARAMRAIESTDLLDAARNPLIAGLICLVAARQDVEPCIFGLYRQYIGQFLTRVWKPRAQWRTDPTKLARAGRDARETAWIMATAHGDDERSPVWLDRATLDWLHRVGMLNKRVFELYTDDGLLVPFGSSSHPAGLDQEVRWLHRTIHEHLVGCALGERLARDPVLWAPFLHNAVLRPNWEIPLKHTAGSLAELPALNKVIEGLWVASLESDDIDSHLLRRLGNFILDSGATHRRSDVVDRLITDGSWIMAVALDPNRAIERGILAAVEDNPYGVEDMVAAHPGPATDREDFADYLATAAPSLALKRLAESAPEQAEQIVKTEVLKARAGQWSFDQVSLRYSTEELEQLFANFNRDPSYLAVVTLMAALQLDVTMPDLPLLRGKWGDLGEFITALMRIDGHPDELLSNHLRPPVAKRLTADAAIPQWATYRLAQEWAYEKGAVAESELGDALTPWAAAGVAFGLLRRGESAHVAHLARDQAESAIDRVLSYDLDAPDPVALLNLWHGCSYLLSQRVGSRMAGILRIVHLNDIAFYPRYWWTDGAWAIIDQIADFDWQVVLQACAESFSASADFFHVEAMDRCMDRISNEGKTWGKAFLAATEWYLTALPTERSSWPFRYLWSIPQSVLSGVLDLIEQYPVSQAAQPTLHMAALAAYRSDLAIQNRSRIIQLTRQLTATQQLNRPNSAS